MLILCIVGFVYFVYTGSRAVSFWRRFSYVRSPTPIRCHIEFRLRKR